MGDFSFISATRLRESGTRCAECGGNLLVMGHELVCSSCGLVQRCFEISELYFSYEGDGHHCLGYSPGLLDGLGSEIQMDEGNPKDGRGQLIPFDREGLYQRLGDASAHLRIRSLGSDTRTVQLMWRVSRLLNLPRSATSSAVHLYRGSATKIRRGNVRRAALAACCLIYANRRAGDLMPLSVHEVLEAFARGGTRLRTREILRAGFLIESGRPIRKGEDYLYPILDRLVSLIDERALRRCGYEDRFHLLQRLLSIARALLKAIGPEVRRGRNPLLVASAAIYASSKLLCPPSTKSLISQRVVALASGTGEFSVRETYESLKHHFCLNPI
jgi:transcription initiation factor TFIIIB Brf1 subunit/transcription initiation factor TFIIB